MKKKSLTLLLSVALGVSLLTGCGSGNESGASVESSVESIVSSEETSTEPESSQASEEKESQAAPEENPEKEIGTGENDLAVKAYTEFLNGERSLKTAECFKEDDEEGNYDGILYGAYDYPALRNAIVENVWDEVESQYTLVDFGNDGVNEMVLRFTSMQSDYMNWTGIIGFDGEELSLNFYYDDGYRTLARLYKDGRLVTEGSAGAGAYCFAGFELDQKGNKESECFAAYYYGTYATSVFYDLTEDYFDLVNSFDDIAASSDFTVTEYKADGVIKISVTDWSTDTETRAREEEMISKMEELGAEVLSEEEMKKLCKVFESEGDEVNWTPFFSEKYENDVYAILEDWEYYGSKEVINLGTNEPGVSIVQIQTKRKVSDVKFLALEFVDVDDHGEITFYATEVNGVDTLNREQLLRLGMNFAGDIPNNGISYVDVDGNFHAFSFGLSGMDGSLVLAPITIQK